jgi:hypothetical protein
MTMIERVARATREDVLDRTAAFLNARCLICGGIEGCSHTELERARAALSETSGGEG